MNNMKNFKVSVSVFALILMLSSLVACRPSDKPQPVVLGQDNCTACGMTIEDPKFACEYITDKENTEAANIDGKEYKPTEGKITVKKKNTIKQLELALTEMYEDNLKLREKISQTELAITELYETMTNG